MVGTVPSRLRIKKTVVRSCISGDILSKLMYSSHLCSVSTRVTFTILVLGTSTSGTGASSVGVPSVAVPAAAAVDGLVAVGFSVLPSSAATETSAASSPLSSFSPFSSSLLSISSGSIATSISSSTK